MEPFWMNCIPLPFNEDIFSFVKRVENLITNILFAFQIYHQTSLLTVHSTKFKILLFWIRAIFSCVIFEVFKRCHHLISEMRSQSKIYYTANCWFKARHLAISFFLSLKMSLYCLVQSPQILALVECLYLFVSQFS